MIPSSPATALGPHAPGVRDTLIEVVRATHDRFAAAHERSGSRYTMVFGTQWRDLLAGAREALQDHGFSSHKIIPAGYRLPIVNGCLVYVWRMTDSSDPSSFVSSPTKKNTFAVSPPEPMLFETVDNIPEEGELERIVREISDTMPLVLVMVRSSPRQLQSIEWAVAELIAETGEVELRGQEAIWLHETVVEAPAAPVESFDSGVPVVPTLTPREQEGSEPDA